MPDPIVEQIAKNIKATVALVTTGNGYNYTLTPHRQIRRGVADDVVPADAIVIIEQGTIMPNEDHDSEGNPPLLGKIVTYFCEVYAIESDTDTDPIEERENRMAADIQMEMMKDKHRGGLAFTTEQGDVSPIIGPELSGMEVEIAVKYCVREDDPYQQG